MGLWAEALIALLVHGDGMCPCWSCTRCSHSSVCGLSRCCHWLQVCRQEQQAIWFAGSAYQADTLHIAPVKSAPQSPSLHVLTPS